MLVNLIVFVTKVLPRIEADGFWEITTRKALPVFSELCFAYDFFADIVVIVAVAKSGYGLVWPCALLFAYGCILDFARIGIMWFKRDVEEREQALWVVNGLIKTFEEAP